MLKALAATPKAKAQWSSLTPIARADFISWIVSARQSETRDRRVKVACSKLIAGHRRPCCYNIVPMNLYKELVANPKAKATWSELTPFERRDFVNWINSATKPDDQKRRVKEACLQLAAGKQQP